MDRHTAFPCAPLYQIVSVSAPATGLELFSKAELPRVWPEGRYRVDILAGLEFVGSHVLGSNFWRKRSVGEHLVGSMAAPFTLVMGATLFLLTQDQKGLIRHISTSRRKTQSARRWRPMKVGQLPHHVSWLSCGVDCAGCAATRSMGSAGLV